MAVEKFPAEISAIRRMLSEHPEGLTIRSISTMLGMNRNSTAKYLDMLQMQGGVALKRSGPSKIYCLADKLPAAAVLKLAKSQVIIFNHDLAAADINDVFTDFLHISKKEILGKTLDLLPFAMQCHPPLPDLIRDGLRGKESRTTASLKIGDHAVPCQLTVSPVFFGNGSNGVSLVIDPDQELKNGDCSMNGTDNSPTELDVTEYICRFSPDGTLSYVNKAYADLLHKARIDLVGHTWRPTIPESEVKKIRICLRSLDHAHPVASLDIRAITQAGDSQWQRWKFRHLFDLQGHSLGYQGTGFDITELKKLEQKIIKSSGELENLIIERKSEIQDLNKQIYDEIASHEKTHFQLQFTQFAMDSASYMITWISREGRFVYMNRQAQHILGYQYRDVISKKFQDIIANVFPFPWDEIWQIIQQDRQYTLETVLRSSRGQEIPVEMVLNFLEFKDKQYCCCFAKDITRRKEAEEALRQSEQKYRDIFERSVSGLFKSTPAGRLVDANDAFARMYGYSSAAEILSADLDMGRDLYVREEERSEVLRILADKDKIENYVSLHKKQDGTTFWVAITARTIRNTEGAVVFYDGTYVDITARKKAEELSVESQQKYQELFELGNEAVFLIDNGTGQILEANAEATKMYGYSRDELLSMRNSDLSTEPEDTTRVTTRTPQGSILIPLRYHKKKDNGVFPVEITGRFFTWKGKSVHVAAVRDITGRMQAEEALRTSETRLLTLVQTVPDLIWLKDKDGVFLSCNPRFERLFGAKESDIVGKTDYDFVDRQLADFFRDHDRNAIAAGKPTSNEEWVTFAEDGHRVLLETIKTPMYDDQGTLIGVLGIGRDITRRKQAEDELHEIARYSRNLIESSLDPLVTISPEGRITDVNQATEQVTGYSRDHLIGTDFSEYFTVPEDARNGYRMMLEKGVVRDYLLEIKNRNGTIRQVLYNAVVYRDEQGTVKGVFATARDITERRIAEEALHLQGEILQNIAEGVVMTRISDGKIVTTNPRFDLMFGYTASELVGRHISTINAPGDKSSETIADEIISTLSQTGTWKGDVLNRRKDGTTFWSHASVSTFNHQQFGPVWVSVQMDITERKRAEEALRHREHDFTTLVENATDLIVRFDRDMHYIYCNPAVEQQLGIPFEQLRGRTPTESAATARETRFIVASLQQTLETGNELEVEQSVPTPSGLRHYLTRIIPERDPDDRIISLLAISRDITEHKRMEEVLQEKTNKDLRLTKDILLKTESNLQLHHTELEMQNEELRQAQVSLEQSRERYFDLYDLAPAGYLTISDKGMILSANLTAATLLGVDRPSLEKKPFTRYIIPEDQDIFYHCRKELIATRKRQLCELRMLHAGDSPFRVQIIAQPAPPTEGDEGSICLMVIDVTALKNAKDALQANEWDFHIMFNSHAAVMLLVEPETGKIIDANRAAERFYGRSTEELCALSMDDINTLPSKELLRKRKMAVKGEVTVFQLQHRLANGEVKSVEVHSSPVTMGEKTVLFSIIHDISGRQTGGVEAAQSPAGEHGLK